MQQKKKQPKQTEAAPKAVRFHLTPRNESQEKYLKKIAEHDMVFGLGPAGTGKTFLAVAAAVEAWKAKRILRIVLVRPVVEAGESLGFLPGTLQEKIDPYMRPLFDALQEMLGIDTVKDLLDRKIIEVAALAYMRGRTLNECFIIADEAQNMTVEQMKMLLTRLGRGSKMVVNGDLTQIDLPLSKASGLEDAIEVLHGVDTIGVHEFNEEHVVRHKLVRQIVRAYDTAEQNDWIEEDPAA